MSRQRRSAPFVARCNAGATAQGAGRHSSRANRPAAKSTARTLGRLSLAARLIDGGMRPARSGAGAGLGGIQPGVRKYSDNQPRVPAGNGRASGQWTSGQGGADAPLGEGRSAGVGAYRPRPARDGTAPVTVVPGLPKDAIVGGSRMAKQSMIPVPKPENSWRRHGQIFRRSMLPASGSPICRHHSSMTGWSGSSPFWRL